MATAPKPVPRRPVRATDALKPFQLVGVRDGGEKVGDGSYSTVKKLEFRGLKCVGKKMHALLYEMANQQERKEMLRRFVSECELLSRLHHPCIVQFLGVYFEEGAQLPVMVMEYLYATLAECLDKYGVLPEEITYGILGDVALGLRYLHEHSPSIIHRDLSANNVLLAADMSAKISDLGVAKILNLSPAQVTQRITTQAPGTPCYMPPEALVSKPSYTSKIDSYSYGVLMIHILCGEWPFPGDAFTEPPKSPGSFLPVSEFDRRREHLLKIGLDHPLMGLIRQCLSNAPASRPEASEILSRIEDLKSSLPPLFENKLEIIQQIQSRCEDTEVEQVSNQTTSEFQLRQINDTLRSENEMHMNQIETLSREIEAHLNEIEANRREIQFLRQRNESQSREIEAQRVEIESKARLKVEDLKRQNDLLGKQIKEQRGEMQSPMREVRYLRQHGEPQSRQIEAQKDEVETETRGIATQNQEILSLREQLGKLSIPLPSPSTTEHEPPTHFTTNPDTQIKWRRCADLAVAMSQLQPVLFKEMVYFGGGYSGLGSSSRPEDFLVFQYDPRRDAWVTLARCSVRLFALSQFQGHLIVVGGYTYWGVPSKKVYRYREESQEWEKYLKPMPTARFSVSVITTPTAIIACGGAADFWRLVAVVEAYIAETGQWHTVDPLPTPHSDMTSVTIDDTCYLLGGHKKSDDRTRVVLRVQVSSLIESATSSPGKLAKAFKKSPWKMLPDTPLFFPAAASICGQLLAVVGHNSECCLSAATHMFVPAKNSWVRMPSGDLPIEVSSSAAIELPGRKLLVCGGWTGREKSKATYMGSFTD